MCALDSRARREWLLILKSRLHTAEEVSRLKNEYLDEGTEHSNVCSLAKSWGVGRSHDEQRVSFFRSLH